MIAIDTNVLLRYVLNDHPQQTEKAAKLIESHTVILITDIVLVETIWTLQGKKYQLDKTQIIKLIHALFQESSFQFENGQIVWQALNDYRKAKVVKRKSTDFADALIVNKARFIAEQKSRKFKGTYTFDKAAQQLSGMETL